VHVSVFATLVASLALTASAHAAAPAPYGTNDAGGFRNVLPPGQAGTENALQLFQFQANGTRPAHWDDQIALYDGLVAAAPQLKADDVTRLFKDATFGVATDDIDRTYSPPGRPGVTIVRDKRYGVPRIYGDTDEDVEFGSGYVAAEDRLFLMDVLRHTGRAQLSSFVGGAESNRRMDLIQWGIAPYTEEDLQRQIDQNAKLYGERGQRAIGLVKAYVAGINAYINEARLNPNKMPGEYAAFGTSPADWKETDVIAEASLIGGIFGKGGGQEVRSALLLRELEAKFGRKQARRVWADFRSKDDPEHSNTVIGKRFPYETNSAFSSRGLALPDPGSVKFEAISGVPENEGRGRDPASTPMVPKLPLGGASHASNWLLVPARNSASGNPIAVMGPQVGYYVPQILIEMELHGPSFDARGATFPGVNLMIQLGHGRNYAWSATTATSDNIDTFAEVLCQDDFHYMYKGKCVAMEKLERTNSWVPNAADDTPPGSETLTAYRTVHGIVHARGTVKGKKVAFALARTTYFHEADSSDGLFRYNDPREMTGPEAFRKATDGINFAFNWSYIDGEHIAYQLSGWYPQRAKGVSPDFPVFGTGEFDWKGFDPTTFTMRHIPLDKRPHAVDQKYLVSWNNKQAPGWAAADDQYAYGSLARQQMLTRFVARGVKAGRKMTLPQLVRAMAEPATQDLRATHVLPVLFKVLGPSTGDDAVDAALRTLRDWRASGGNRRDLDHDGKYDHDAAVTLMDAWWPRLARGVFAPALGEKAMSRLEALLPVGEERGGSPSAPDFFGGWWGYVSKDLRTLFKLGKVRGRYSRTYCGGGSRAKCLEVLKSTLREALGVAKEKLYGFGACASDPDAECWDRNRSVEASAIGVPPMLFQNRPTFQQTVEIP
jgi:acyl-homoserine lactone acylase PvdQ